jgi:hypothetical protein
VTDDSTAHGAGFWAGVALGWATVGYGMSLTFSTRDGVATAAEVAAWIAGGHLLHDAVVAPAAAIVGLALAAVLAPAQRGPVRAGLVTSACVIAVAYPALRGFGAKPRNPSVLPLDYGTAVLTVLGVVWVVVAIAMIARSRGDARRASRDRERGDAEEHQSRSDHAPHDRQQSDSSEQRCNRPERDDHGSPR